MDANNTFQRFAGITAIFSCPVAFLSLWLILSAFDFDVDIASDPARAIAYAPDPSFRLFWGWIFDIFGYYLPLIPLLIFLQHTFSSTHPLLSRFAFYCGSAYVVTDALGAAMLAGTTVFCLMVTTLKPGIKSFMFLCTVFSIAWFSQGSGIYSDTLLQPVSG